MTIAINSENCRNDFPSDNIQGLIIEELEFELET